MLNPNEKQDPNIDWKDLSFRRRSRSSERPGSDHRFAIGLGVFVLVALLFPWYAYEVFSYSVYRDTAQALNDFGIETQEQIDEENAISEKKRVALQARRLAQRIAAVRVMGVSSGGNVPMVLVNLGKSNAYEAQSVICQQAGRWLNKDISGLRLRIQSYRGNRPALDAGEIGC